MKNIFFILFLLPCLVSAQQYIRTQHGSQIWMVNVTGDLASNTLSIMNGNVGIGIAMPTSALQVFGNIDNMGLGDVTFGQGFARISTTTTLVNLGDLGGSASNEIFTIDANNKYAYYDNSPHDTKFGINTSTPSVALDVVGDQLISNSSATGFKVYNSVTSSIGLLVDNENRYVIAGEAGGETSYRVGINVATPSVALDVVGNVKIDNGTNAGVNTLATTTTIGDFLVLGNGTKITVRDASSNIDLTNNIQFSSYGAGVLTTDGSGNITAVSDRRVKHDIKPFTMGIKELRKLSPSTFIYNQDSTNTVMPGFIAQDVEKAFNGVGIGHDKQGMLSLNTNVVLAALVNGFKEQQKQIEVLQSQNNQLLKQLGSTGNRNK